MLRHLSRFLKFGSASSGKERVNTRLHRHTKLLNTAKEGETDLTLCTTNAVRWSSGMRRAVLSSERYSERAGAPPPGAASGPATILRLLVLATAIQPAEKFELRRERGDPKVSFRPSTRTRTLHIISTLDSYLQKLRERSPAPLLYSSLASLIASVPHLRRVTFSL